MPIFRVGKPRCLLTFAVNTASPGNGTVIPFTQADIEGDISRVGGVVTIAKEGHYLISFGVGRASGAGIGILQATVRRNTGAYILAHSNNGTGSCGVSGARYGRLLVGDTIDIITSNGGTFRATDTFLDVVRLGPEKWTG